MPVSNPTTEPMVLGDLAGVLDVPIPYLQRVRSYYQGLGYGAPYEWAQPEAPPQLHRLGTPITQCRIAIVTTAAPVAPGTPRQSGKPSYDASIKFYKVTSPLTDVEVDLRINHVAIDWDHTTAVDQGTYFPLRALRSLAARRTIGDLSPRFHCVPTHRSQRTTISEYVPELVRRCREDDVDAALLVPNCPVCHQTMALAARGLEEAGISTVVMGAARDIVEYVGVPRLLFSDLPLGNACGKPGDEGSQMEAAQQALALLESATFPRTTMKSTLIWSSDPAWKLDYSNIARLSAEAIAQRRAEFDQVKETAKQMRRATT